MSNFSILQSQQAAWKFLTLIEADLSAGRNTIILANPSGGSVSLTGFEMPGQQKNAAVTLLNNGSASIVLLASHAEALTANQFADPWTLLASTEVRLLYNGLRWEVLTTLSTVAVVNPPLNLGDASAASFWSLTGPLSSHLLYGNFSPRKSIPVGEGLAVTEFYSPVTLNGQVSKMIASSLRAIDVQGPSTDSYVVGSYISMFSNASSPTGANATLEGIHASVDVGGPWANAYGGFFAAFMGGSGAAGTGIITGVIAKAGAIHNGDMGQAYAGDFEVFASLGSPGTLTKGACVRARMRINGGATFADFRGVSISDWSSPSGGSVTNMIGLYIDSTIDAFGTTKFAIKSDSVSDSLFAGPVRGPVSPYDATAWNGSSKFATEDAVRDKFESLGTGGGLTFVDHFYSTRSTRWRAVVATGGSANPLSPQEAGAPGVIRITSGSSNGGISGMGLQDSITNGTFNPADNFDFTIRFRPVQNSNEATFRLGLFPIDFINSLSDAICIRKEAADSAFTPSTVAGGVTTNGTPFAAYTGNTWHTIRIRRIGATIGFIYDGGTEQIITTNIPTAALVLAAYAVRGISAPTNLDLDYLKLDVL